VPVGDLAGEIALVLGAVAVIVTSVVVPRRLQVAAAPLALVACILSGVLIARRMAGGAQALTFMGAWSLDDVAAWAELIILAVTGLTVVLSPEWMRGDARHGEWYAMVLFSAAGAMVMASATDTLQLMVGVLLSSVTGYVLASYHRRSALSVEAGMKYFLAGALANTVLLVGITVLFGVAGTTRYDETARVVAGGAPVAALVAVVVLVAVGLAFKAGAVPVHTWVPDVAEGAPAPAAAFLTVVPKVGGVVALARIVTVLPDGVVGWRPLVALLAAVTMTVGNLAALWQEDLRRLLGWSSVSQAGYALMAIPVVGRSDQALGALVFFLAAYAVGQLAAFGVVTELRGRTRLDDYRGLAGRRPWLAAALVLALLSMVGVPPLGGFVGKLLLFGATVDGGYAWLAAVAVANTVVSLFYYLRVVAPMAFDPAPGPVPVLGRWATAATALATAAVVGLGVGAEGLLDTLQGAQLLP